MWVRVRSTSGYIKVLWCEGDVGVRLTSTSWMWDNELGSESDVVVRLTSTSGMWDRELGNESDVGVRLTSTSGMGIMNWEVRMMLV